MRDLVAKMKLIPVRQLVEGKRMIFCDDSIVRGTQLKDNTQKLFDQGAKEVHMRIACPPLLFPCEFLNFSASKTRLELAGRMAVKDIRGTDEVDLQKYIQDDSAEYHDMVEHIRGRLKLTLLKFQKLKDLIAAIGLPKEKLCTHCWDNSSYM